MNTSEEHLKYRLYYFSLGYAAKSYMNKINKFRKLSFPIKTLTLNTEILIIHIPVLAENFDSLGKYN